MKILLVAQARMLRCKRGKAYAIMTKVAMGNGGFYGCLIESQMFHRG